MSISSFLLVRLTGLEPARRETLDPKSSASTNSATGAASFEVFAVFAAAKVILFVEIAKLFFKKLCLFGGLEKKLYLCVYKT